MKDTSFKMIDLFAGIGGLRLGFEKIGGNCVFTSEWDKFAAETYRENFPHDASNPEHFFAGDIKKVEVKDIPDHDLLLAGFPCQPFSLAGVSAKQALGKPHGFEDLTQGTLFFDIARILKGKRPKCFLLENVRNLLSHDRGRTFKVIEQTLEDLNYWIEYAVVDSRSWVPQKRKRILIVGFEKKRFPNRPAFDFDNLRKPRKTKLMRDILHPEDGSEKPEEGYTKGSEGLVDRKYMLTKNLWRYLREYARKHRAQGNGFGYGMVGPEDIARTLSARYYKDGSEVLVDRGKYKHRPRRLTPRECARLMGFPDDFKIPVSDTQAYKQFGNSVVVPMVDSVAELMEPLILEAVSTEKILIAS